MKNFVVFTLGLFLTPLAAANQWVESFSNTTTTASQTAVLNLEFEALHPQLRAIDYEAITPPPMDFDVGDGSHGAFEPATYANFSVGGNLAGNIIRLDTSVYPILQVTHFHLATGWFLEPVGTAELVIYSQGDVVVEGEIWCHGRNGTNSAGVTPGLGGQGRCGGSRGGDGGLPNDKGEDAPDVTVDVTGGVGGNFFGGAPVDGGGGGSWNDSSLAGNGIGVNAGGGQGGASESEPYFMDLSGAAGGGGGSGFGGQAGAGGGAGGGTVVIHTVRDFILGNDPDDGAPRILVYGGNGGTSATGGEGGGGGGGSIKVYAGRTISIHDSDPLHGGSPVNGGVGSGVNGGGAIGRNWFASLNYNPFPATGFYTPAEQTPVIPGPIEFTDAPQEWISTAFDTLSTNGTVQSIVANPVSSDYVIELAGSTDNFVVDDTGWQTDLSLLTNKRYLRMRVTVTNTLGSNADFLEDVTVNFTPGTDTVPEPGGPTATDISRFEFVAASGCGSLKTKSDTHKPLVLLFLPVALALFLRLRNSKTRIALVRN